MSAESVGVNEEPAKNILDYYVHRNDAPDTGAPLPAWYDRLGAWYESSGEGTVLGILSLLFALTGCGMVVAIPMALGALLAPNARKIFPLATLGLLALYLILALFMSLLSS